MQIDLERGEYLVVRHELPLVHGDARQRDGHLDKPGLQGGLRPDPVLHVQQEGVAEAALAGVASRRDSGHPDHAAQQPALLRPGVVINDDLSSPF